MAFGLGPKTATLLILTLVLGVVTMAVWALVPPNISGVTVEPVLLGEDEQGNIVELNAGGFSLLSTQVSYPGIKKIQMGVKATVKLIGMSSTKLKWWLDYRIQVKPEAQSGYRDYDAWQANYETDAGWAPYWRDQWFNVNDGDTFDLEPNKKAWWDKNLHAWKYNHGDGWIPLDPDVYASVGDWIKWSGTNVEGEQGWAQTPAGNYDVKVSLHVKINFEDNFGKERSAMGPPEIRPAGIGPALKSGEIFDFASLTVTYEPGTVEVTLSPNIFRIWLPLDFAQTLQPSMMLSVSDMFATVNLPTWFPHAILTVLTIASAIATVYYYNEGE